MMEVNKAKRASWQRLSEGIWPPNSSVRTQILLIVAAVNSTENACSSKYCLGGATSRPLVELVVVLSTVLLSTEMGFLESMHPISLSFSPHSNFTTELTPERNICFALFAVVLTAKMLVCLLSSLFSLLSLFSKSEIGIGRHGFGGREGRRHTSTATPQGNEYSTCHSRLFLCVISKLIGFTPPARQARRRRRNGLILWDH